MKAKLEERFGKWFVFVDHPVKQKQKPFKITVNGEVLYSILNPVNEEKKPIFFVKHRYFGEPDPTVFENLVEKIRQKFNTFY